MRTACSLLAALALVAATGLAAFADTPAVVVPANAPAQVVAAQAAARPTSFAPMGMGLAVIGVGIGLGLIGYAAMGGIARQPEQAGNIRTAMLIIGGLVEGAGIIGLVFCLVAHIL